MASNNMQFTVRASAMISMRYIYVSAIRFKDSIWLKALIGKLWAENLLKMSKWLIWCQSKDLHSPTSWKSTEWNLYSLFVGCYLQNSNSGQFLSELF